MHQSNAWQLRPVVNAIICLTFQSVWAADTPPAAAPQTAPAVAVQGTLPVVRVSAEAELKQSAGVSIIESDDIEKQPVANDISELIRKMPGVNLTGNTATGQRGNNRQIDLRGMGPENTLILIDGKPVMSRNAVRYGRTGERDTRGDSNWVAAEQIERIEVIRGPAASRYGSGAAGGVVNIITKGISAKTAGSVSVYANQPQHSEEGASHRINARVAGPINPELGYSLSANVNKTDSDDPSINVDHKLATATTAAGREGVRNKDLKALLQWKPSAQQTVDFDYAFSRQGNIYAGDTGTSTSATSSASATGSNPASFLGQETNVMTRKAYAVEHRSTWNDASSRSFVQYENTLNKRLSEGMVGGIEGNINSATFYTGTLDNLTAHTEQTRFMNLWAPQMVTFGVEANRQKLDDPGTILAGQTITGVSGVATNATDRPTRSSANLAAAFVEDSLDFDELNVIPGLRLDHHTAFGDNWSPSLNLSRKFGQGWTVKGGVARVFKAPNLYQLDPNYVNYSSGNGCNKTLANTTACYLIGNADLKPETSTNKELGLAWTNGKINAGFTWFRNDYNNKIVGGADLVATVTVGTQKRYVYQWENATNAIVEGYEANLALPLAASVDFSVNGTYMKRNNDQYGQTLSVIPKYTVNANLQWRINEQWNTGLQATFYGEQKPRTTNAATKLALTGDALTTREAYHLLSASLGYQYDRSITVRMGVNNLLDKREFREGNNQTAGAATYNEPGRSVFVTATKSF